MAEQSEAKQDQPSYEPRIVAFCCNWCSYAGADLAGTTRLQYPPNVRIVRVMCSGRVDPAFVLKAFSLGADGVIVAGCHPSDCHYINGNEKTAAGLTPSSGSGGTAVDGMGQVIEHG